MKILDTLFKIISDRLSDKRIKPRHNSLTHSKCLIFLIMLISFNTLAQKQTARKQKDMPEPLPLRQVSGMIKDEKGQPYPAAVVTLTSTHDSLRTTTNEEGIFIFNNVKQATFYINITGLGVLPMVRKFLNNDLSAKIVLDPIELKTKENMLGEVKINGRPTIVYKIDTVEFRASDYKVRTDATVDELLKKVEGMEVAADGSLTYQGQDVKKMRLNGRDFAGGNVAQVIQNLPADIIEKIQIVDDYGDIAARTGIKDGTPVKQLNLTTKDDRSIGTYGRLSASGGNKKRYQVQPFFTHINANQAFTLSGKFENSINGISNGLTGNTGSLPGSTIYGNPTLSYRDQWGKTLQISSNYGHTYTNNNTDSRSYGENYSYGQNGDIMNTSSFNKQNTAENNSLSHIFNLTIDLDIDKFNYLKITPSFTYSNSNNESRSLSNYLNYFTTGFEHPLVNAHVGSDRSNKDLGITVLYQHVFSRPKRIFSIQLNTHSSRMSANGDKLTNFKYFSDSTFDHSLRDSTSHLITVRTSNTSFYNSTINYTEPLSNSSKLELYGKLSSSVYDNNATSDTVLANGHLIAIPQLASIFNYSFNEAKMSIAFTYNQKKLIFSLGTAALETTLKGTKIDNNTLRSVSTNPRNNFRLIPVFRLSYIWSNTERFTMNYSGTNTAPNFLQIQPFIDRSDPNNIIIGNPDLKPAFLNTLALSYDRYIANAKVSVGLDLQGTIYSDQVTTNIVQVAQQIATAPIRYKTINEIYFVNLDGTKSISFDHTFTKSLAEHKYSISLIGNATYGYNVAMSNNIAYHNVNWKLSEKLGPKFNPTDALEVNPNISYERTSSNATLAGTSRVSLSASSVALAGRYHFKLPYQFSFNIIKSYISGLKTSDTDPLIVNLGLNGAISKWNGLTWTFNAYDLLHQNNFIQQVITTQGFINTDASSASRYFLIGFRMTFQHWGGKPTRNGNVLKRKGDGSFIY